MFVKKNNKNVSVSKVRFDEIMLYEFVKNIYCQGEIPDKKINDLLEKLYNYLDKKIFNYIDTDRDIIDIQAYVKLTYEREK